MKWRQVALRQEGVGQGRAHVHGNCPGLCAESSGRKTPWRSFCQNVASAKTRRASMPGLSRFECGFDGVVDAEELMILGEDFCCAGFMLREKGKVLRQIEQAVGFAGSAQKDFEGDAAGSHSDSIRFQSKKRSQSAVREPILASVPLEAIKKAL